MKIASIFYILFVPVIAIVGYGIMHLIAFVFPLSETSIGSAVAYMLLIAALGMATGYFMLKSGMHIANLENRREKELTLRDIPKDQTTLNQSR